MCARACFTHTQTQVKKKHTQGEEGLAVREVTQHTCLCDRQKAREDSYLQPLPLSVASLSVYAARPSSSVPQVGMVGLTWGCTRGNEEDGEARDGG